MNNIFFEIITFFYIMRDANMMKNFKKNFFTEPTIVNVFDIVKDFVVEYKSEPTKEQVIELVQMAGRSEEITPEAISALWENRHEVDSYQESWLKPTILGWAKYRSFYKGLENTVAFVKQMPNNIDYSDYEYYISKASNLFNNGVSFSVYESEGHDFFDVDNHIIPSEDTHSTGYNFFDLCLKGGFTKKGLYVIMGAPKVGKSMWLCNLAANSVKQGYNTIYITLEMSYQLVSQRIGANLFNIPIDDYNTVAEDKNKMREYINKFMNGQFTPPGKFFIEEFPTSSASASDIENFILKKEEELSRIYGDGFKFQNVCIDYINIMRDQRGNNSDNSYTKIKNICEDVRAMAQRNMWSVISLTQTNRSGQDASDLSMTNVSESSGLVATVDALFGIIQTTMMKASNVYYIKALALRNAGYMDCKKKYIFDNIHLKLIEDDKEGILQTGIDIPKEYTSATANAVSKNKTGVVNGVPTQYAPPQMDANLVDSEYKLRNEMGSLFS